MRTCADALAQKADQNVLTERDIVKQVAHADAKMFNLSVDVPVIKFGMKTNVLVYAKMLTLNAQDSKYSTASLVLVHVNHHVQLADA